MAMSPLSGCPGCQGDASRGGEGTPGGPDLRVQLRALWPQKERVFDRCEHGFPVKWAAGHLLWHPERWSWPGPGTRLLFCLETAAWAPGPRGASRRAP